MEKEDDYLPVTSANEELIQSSGAHELLTQIRPHWQAKNLIQRVEKLLKVDPSRVMFQLASLLLRGDTF